MNSHSYESDSAEQASTTADEVEESSRRSTTEDESADDSTTDTDSNGNGRVAATRFAGKNLTPRSGKKYANGLLDAKKLNVQSDTETKNLLDDIGEDFDEDCLNLQETEIDLDTKMFDISEEQLNYYTNCFLYLLEKTQGFASLQGALQGSDRVVIDFFRKSCLDDLSLSRIWSLSDVNEDGFLNHHEFITAMHLIVLHIKGNMPIPTQLPPSTRPPNTPARSLVRFDNGSIGAFPNSQPDSTSDSSTRIISECISSTSDNSQQLIVSLNADARTGNAGIAGTVTQKQERPNNSQPLTIPTNSTAIAQSSFVDMSTSVKQHSFSDDHLHSTASAQATIAKFSDVPPLLVDSQPTALNAATTSQILPKFAHLLAYSQRGPPPQPPYRDYNTTQNASKGHGRSVSLDLKTFSALSTTYRSNKDHKSVDEPDGIAAANNITAVINASANTSTLELLGSKMLLPTDKSIQTLPLSNMTSTATQTISIGSDDLSEENFAMCIRDLDGNKLAPKERCQLLQRINEQLELERSTLMQVRLQVQLRIEEAELELKEQSACGLPRSGNRNKPTPL